MIQKILFKLLVLLFLYITQVESSIDTCTFTTQYLTKANTSRPFETTTNSTCIQLSQISLSIESEDFNREYLNGHCSEICERDAVALVSFLDDEVPDYLGCHDGPIYLCEMPYIVFTNKGSTLFLFEPLRYRSTTLQTPYWTQSDTLGSFFACAYGNGEQSHLFTPHDHNCSLTLPWLCKCLSLDE